MADEENQLPEPESESEKKDEDWRLLLMLVLYQLMFTLIGFLVSTEARLSFKLGSDGDEPFTIKTHPFLLFAMLPLLVYWGFARIAFLTPESSLLAPFRFRVSGDGHAKLLPRVATAISLTMFELALESELRQGPLFHFEHHLMINLAIALIGNAIALIYEEAFSRKLIDVVHHHPRIRLLYFGACLAFTLKIAWILSWTIDVNRREEPLGVGILFSTLCTWNFFFSNIVYTWIMRHALSKFRRDQDSSAFNEARTFAAFADVVLTCVWVGMSAGALVTLSQLN